MNRKDANIGATVSLLKMIHVITPGEELPLALAGLFTEEAKGCDYRANDHCTFACEVDVVKLDTPGTKLCAVGNCPLGDEVDKAAKEGDFPTITEYAQKREKERTFGCDPDLVIGTDTPCGHIHVGYTGWRKLWNGLKLWTVNSLQRVLGYFMKEVK